MGRRIKGARPSPAILVAVMALLAALAGTAIAANPVATTSAKKLTKKKVKKIATKAAGQVFDSRIGAYYTKDQVDQGFYTKGQVDQGFYTKGAADARFLSKSGRIVVTPSPQSWELISAAPGVPPVRPEIGGTTFGGTTGAIQDVPVALAPTLPVELGGVPLRLVKINACYDNDAITTLDTVRIWRTQNSNGSGNSTPLLTDATDRGPNTSNCEDFVPTSSPVIAPQDTVALEFSVDYSSNAGFFFAGRATFYLEPAP
jgi:hypothetical protein